MAVTLCVKKKVSGNKFSNDCQRDCSEAWGGTKILDCNNECEGSAYLDNCFNCVGGNTGFDPCIPFSPTLSISLSTLDCNTTSDITFTASQDANEPDMSTFLFTTSDGSFDIASLNIGQNIG